MPSNGDHSLPEVKGVCERYAGGKLDGVKAAVLLQQLLPYHALPLPVPGHHYQLVTS